MGLSWLLLALLPAVHAAGHKAVRHKKAAVASDKTCDLKSSDVARLGGTQPYVKDGWTIFRDPAELDELAGVFCVHGNRLVSAPKIPDSFVEKGDDLIWESHTVGKTGAVNWREKLYVDKKRLREAPTDTIGSFHGIEWAWVVLRPDNSQPRNANVALDKKTAPHLRQILELAPEGHVFHDKAVQERIIKAAASIKKTGKNPVVTLMYEPYTSNDIWETMEIVRFPGGKALKLADLTKP